ncbi:B12-binding domain-containing radical SAM protein [Pikeienuella piscinae]|uniref:B12-binding domain-containing radical SAM protein n=1 Tax=Pikeienuella piscinae TaxID=2748098 RepID=A0A7M3T5Y6_9RHOB|nr:B12-binding domain-containing radical SAM protein [Pikeienuella piscinae]QIE57417.1 B12-binding domain-containing radical SAM protein [Pikeienuella piscinae]
MSRAAPNVLFIHPKFSNTSFWNYVETCELVGAKYPAPPLGLITVAAMLPESWRVRLVDRNVAELTDEEIDAADLVMFGGMITQQMDLLATAARAKARGKITVVGGPDVSSSPEIYADLDFRIIGEAEGAIDAFIDAWETGASEGEFRAPLHSIDVTKTPNPRFDLLNFSNYVQLNVQFSRGCPFLCEFCDIIELFGRKPRTKDTAQILAELDRIYALGYRGHVDFVDDNLIGNKKAVKLFLPHLVDWQKRHGYPFEFSTEASLNLADDDEFLGMMRDAGFFACFVGIESPDPDVLVAMQKKQNTKRDIASCIHKINTYGIFIVAGFIVGFDNESELASEGMIELIEEASIPVSMVGLLVALPNTQLQRRLEKEQRLHDLFGVIEDEQDGDQCVSGLNFETLRPRADILEQYLKVVKRIYEPANYFARVRKTVELLDCSGVVGDLRRSTIRHDVKQFIQFLWNITVKRPDMRGHVWRLLAHVLRKNPRAIKHALYTAGLYAHLGPFAQYVQREMASQIAAVKADPNAPRHRTFRGKLEGVAAE